MMTIQRTSARENLKEAMKNRLSTAELTNIVIENATDPAKPFIYKYHIRVPEYALAHRQATLSATGFLSERYRRVVCGQHSGTTRFTFTTLV